MKTLLAFLLITIVVFLFSGSSCYSFYNSMPLDSLSGADSLRISDSLERVNDSIILNRQIVIYIGKLNFDTYPDTVIGKRWQQFMYMPTVIRWGIKNDTLPPEIDSAHYVPDSLKVFESEIKYPVWKDIRGNITFDNINKDSVQDLLFAISGISYDTVNPVSYKRIIAVFGQDYLDTMHVIDISTIDSFQIHPFIALNLQPGNQLISPDRRDVSKGTSYILPRINLPVRDTTSTDSTTINNGGSGELISGVEENNYRLRVYPNPAAYFITIEALKLLEGIYFVEITNSAGHLVNKQKVEVQSNGELLQKLDLRSIATGYYMIKLHTNQSLLGVYQILVIH